MRIQDVQIQMSELTSHVYAVDLKGHKVDITDQLDRVGYGMSVRLRVAVIGLLAEDSVMAGAASSTEAAIKFKRVQELLQGKG